jgi:hypothetical protein
MIAPVVGPTLATFLVATVASNALKLISVLAWRFHAGAAQEGRPR